MNRRNSCRLDVIQAEAVLEQGDAGAEPPCVVVNRPDRCLDSNYEKCEDCFYKKGLFDDDDVVVHRSAVKVSCAMVRHIEIGRSLETKRSLCPVVSFFSGGRRND